MPVGYLDLVGGISGDMFVGALLDAGWPEEALCRSVAWLGPEIAELRVETRRPSGFRGQGILVVPSASASDRASLSDLLRRVGEAPLDPDVRARAANVFRRLAEAESRAHGVPLGHVHLHEVGAIDALVDVVAACCGVRELGLERLHVSPVPLGRGQVEAAHGAIPLPAPATAILLEGAPVRWTGVEGERCTPTGAALVCELGTWSPPPPMTLTRVGCGAGTRSFPDVPNLARLFLGEVRPPESGEGRPASVSDLGEPPTWGWGEGSAETCPGNWNRVAVLCTQIDDATPEEIGWLSERLRAGPALDVLVEPVQMKKSRIGFHLTVIARLPDEQDLVAELLAHSSTLGVRRRIEWRRELERAAGTVDTPYGAIQVKLARRGGGWVAEPEYESCRRAAEKAGAGVRDVMHAAARSIEAAREAGTLGTA